MCLKARKRLSYVYVQACVCVCVCVCVCDTSHGCPKHTRTPLGFAKQDLAILARSLLPNSLAAVLPPPPPTPLTSPLFHYIIIFIFCFSLAVVLPPPPPTPLMSLLFQIFDNVSCTLRLCWKVPKDSSFFENQKTIGELKTKVLEDISFENCLTDKPRNDAFFLFLLIFC